MSTPSGVGVGVGSARQSTQPAPGNHGNGVLLKHGGASLAEENDEGSVEYKWRLVGITEQRLNHLVTQMKFRVAEGRGECMYEIGVEDDGYTRGLPQAEFDESIATLRTMASRLGFTLEINCVVSKPNPADAALVLKCAEVRVRKIVQTLPTCRVAIIGDTNSGKSTLVGVIASGALDDGSGTVRQSVFNHKHELQSGKTSSVCDRVVGFGKDGIIVNYDAPRHHVHHHRCSQQGAAGGGGGGGGINNSGDQHGGGTATGTSGSGMADRNSSDFITDRSATLSMLIDLPGCLRRSHTALSALVGRFPHIVAVVVNPADAQNVHTHVAQCAALHLPFFVVLTHQDSTQPVALGQAAAAVDRAVSAATGKRLVMVSVPIYPGEDEGGGGDGGGGGGGGAGGSRSMMHASSDMFLSDLGSTDGGSDSGATSPRDANSSESPGASPTRGAATDAAAGAIVSGAHMAPRNVVEQYLERHVPVFIVSCVSGYGVPLLKHFLHQLSLSPPRLTSEVSDGAGGTRLVVDKVYSQGRIGLVAAGIVTSGALHVGQQLYWGPSKLGAFFAVTVNSLHYQRNFVVSVGSGNECAVAFENGDQLPPEVVQMASRRGTMLFSATTPASNDGATDGGATPLLPPATSRDFRVLVTKQHAVAAAQDWKVDQEVTAFVFSAKQAAFLRKIVPADIATDEYAAVRTETRVGDAARPLIMHCSFCFFPEVLAVGVPIVLLRNTPDGRLGAVAGRVLSFDACVARVRDNSESSGEADTPPRTPTSALSS